MDLYGLIFSVLLIRSNTIRACTPAALIKDNALFAKELYPILARKEGNVLYSPVSAHGILSLLYQAATGNTAKSFENALHAFNAEQTAIDYKTLLKLLSSVENQTLNIVNKVFVPEQSKVKEEFNSVARDEFLAGVENVNFVDNVATAKRINELVETETKKKITNLIKPGDLNELTRLVLVNAIYFIGNWWQPFDSSDTKTEKFYVSENDNVYCDMMHLQGYLSYSEDDNLDAQILRLPYKDNNLALTIILPKSKTGMKELENKVKTISVNFRPIYYTASVDLSLPRFKIEAELDLKNSLTELGLGAIFTPSAEFPNLLESAPLHVSKAIHKAFIEVNEVGTKGAGGTAMKGVDYSLRTLYPKVTFTADHPFIFLITYKQLDGLLPLFVGKLARP